MDLSQRQLDALQHIAENCRKAIDLAGRLRTQARLEADWEAQYALMRCVEIIGEAASRLGAQFYAEHSEVSWRLIVGMRNSLIHGYDSVELPTLWHTATQGVPELLTQIEAIDKAIRTQ